MQLKVDIEKQLHNFTLRAAFTMQDEVFALLGASGFDKSMTLKCIAGMMAPDYVHIEPDGQVRYDSVQGINLPLQERHIGYLFQSCALFPNMTIHENIRLVAVGMPEEKEQKVAAGPRQFHLEELAEALALFPARQTHADGAVTGQICIPYQAALTMGCFCCIIIMNMLKKHI